MGLTDIIVSIFAKFFPPEEPKADEAASPKPAPEPQPPKVHWKGDMLPLAAGQGEKIEHFGSGGCWSGGSVRLEWVSRETDGEGRPLRTRTPESQVSTMPYDDFTAAGQHYTALHQLVDRWEGKSSSWARDIYGRAVLMAAEPFPCFDSSDYLYEDRCFRWFLLCEGGKLTSVYYTDKTDTVTVTEDVLDLEKPCWKEMQQAECFAEDGA